MTGEVIFDPLLPWPAIWALAALSFGLVALALWRGLSGWAFRGLAAAVLVAALAQPAFQREDRQGLSDIVILVVDETASQRLPGRAEQTAAAVAAVEAEIAALPGTELRRVTLRDAGEDAGSLLLTELSAALAEEPRARVAGAILVSDGQAHDLDLPVDLPAPLHLIQTGFAGDWDRRLVIETAPTFGIIGEPVSILMRIEEQGALPGGEAGRDVAITIAVDGGDAQAFRVPVGRTLELPVTLDHAGQNVVQVTLETAAGELTDRNNAAVIQINGVRDRLRVLLVSGEPHAGERTWRNLLKSDAAVDLVHFTILRPPEKQDGVPVSELSLIAFPTRELFVEKIEEFDLIIFDRYRLRGILPSVYLQNIRDYVQNGGAVLISAGPEFAEAESLYYSGLGEIMPGRPTARVIAQGFTPQVTDLGQRHPVTEGLVPPEAETPPWGRWLRQIDLAETRGQAVMSGADDRPLLLLDRVGEGRVALLASDHIWLWGRGFEGGGPQLELLRRLAHWMMKEPELEEEALVARGEGGELTVTRRSLGTVARDVTVTAPDGTETVLPLAEVAPGRFAATMATPEPGLYRLTDGEMERVIALGPAAPREFEETIATGEKLAPVIEATQGGVVRIEEGAPDIRAVREGRVAAGRGWIGITPRGAYLTTDIRVAPLLPAWAFLLIASALILGGWLREGRR